MVKAFQEHKYLWERVGLVHQSTGILTVLLINCFCVYVEDEQLPISKYLTPVVILTQPMRALASTDEDVPQMLERSSHDLKSLGLRGEKQYDPSKLGES